MSAIRSMSNSGLFAGASLRAAICAMVLLSASAAAPAQQPQQSDSPPAAAESKFDPFGSIARWFDQSFSKLGSSFKDAKSNVDNFNREAAVAARSTTEAAKDAADAVVRLPTARVVTGHQNCAIAANGAPDCLSAAGAMCKAQGFQSGKSVDITTAEECPTSVMLGRRAAEPGECRTVNFVSRALCQ
jgi:hypothetical protein